MNNVACVYLKVVAHQQRKKHDKQTNKPKNCVFFILWFKMSNASMYISLLNSMAIFKICTIFTAHFTRRVSRLPLIHDTWMRRMRHSFVKDTKYPIYNNNMKNGKCHKFDVCLFFHLKILFTNDSDDVWMIVTNGITWNMEYGQTHFLSNTNI